MTSILKKKAEDSSDETKSDIHGRIEYIDQSLRSADHRISAIEKRLSIRAAESTIKSDIENDHFHNKSISEVTCEDLHELDEKISHLETMVHDMHTNEYNSLKKQVSDIGERTSKLENLNRITIGKIKVPVEFSGLAATIVMFVTGYLIYTNHWNIIRSSYYPIAVGILFGIVVAGKFIISNRGHIK